MPNASQRRSRQRREPSQADSINASDHDIESNEDRSDHEGVSPIAFVFAGHLRRVIPQEDAIDRQACALVRLAIFSESKRSSLKREDISKRGMNNFLNASKVLMLYYLTSSWVQGEVF